VLAQLVTTLTEERKKGRKQRWKGSRKPTGEPEISVSILAHREGGGGRRGDKKGKKERAMFYFSGFRGGKIVILLSA